MSDQQHPVETIYRSAAREDCLAQALVLETTGFRHKVVRDGAEFALVVAGGDAARARAELDDYASENREWPAEAVVLPQRGSGWPGVFGYALVLLLVAVLEYQRAFALDWHAAGKTHAGSIRHGELWRAMTALTLHADLAHLGANVLIGGLIGLFAGQLFGSGLAWISILMAGTAGNVLNAWVRHATHTSVGASTAVFGALGLVAAYSWQRRRHMRGSRLRRWAPLVGGAVLLSLLGTGGGRTDVGAHVAGFFCGALLGALYGKLGEQMFFTARGQLLLGAAALALLATAWTLAL